MAVSGSRAPLQARNELLSGLVAVYQSQRDAFDLEDLQALLRWLDGFVRHPVGADDVTPVPGVLPPVQKAALAALGQVAGGAVAPAAAWPDVLGTLSGLLCPFRAAQQRRVESEAAAAAAAAAAGDVAASSGASSALGGRQPSAAAAAASASPPPGLPKIATAGSFGPGRAALLSPRSLARPGRCVILSWLGFRVGRLGVGGFVASTVRWLTEACLDLIPTAKNPHPPNHSLPGPHPIHQPQQPIGGARPGGRQ